MLSWQLVVIWTFIINGVGALLWGYLLRTAPPSGQRAAFLGFLGPYLIWANGLLAIQLVGHQHPASRFVSEVIFFGGAAFHLMLGRFLVLFSDPREVHTWRFRLLFWNCAGVALLSFSGVFERGVAADPSGALSPVPGPLLPYYNGSLVVWGLYYFAHVAKVCRRPSIGDLLTAQLRLICLPAAVSIAIVITTNVIVPGTTGDYTLTPIGGFWLFLLFAAVAYTLALGGDSVLVQPMRILAHELTVDLEEGGEVAARIIRRAVLERRSQGREPTSKAWLSLTPDDIDRIGLKGGYLPQ